MFLPINKRKTEPFGMFVLIVGAFLLLISVIKGTYMIVAFVHGIPLYSLSEIKINVINVFFNFLIPFIGGVLLILSGLTIIYYNKSTTRHIIVKKARRHFKKEKSNLLNGLLNESERKILNIIKEKNGILQSDLTVKSGFSKVKIHRILKKLENMNVIKKSRFGITNRVFVNETQ